MSVPQEKKYRKLLADIIAKEDEELYDGLDEDTTDVLSSVLDALGQVDSDNEHNS